MSIKKVMALFVVGSFVAIPLHTNAYTLDEIVQSYLAYLRNKIYILENENASLKSQVASCGNLSAEEINAQKASKVATDRKKSECDALSDVLKKKETALLDFNKETDEHIAEMKKNQAGAFGGAVNDSINAYIRPRDVTFRQMSDEKNVLQTQWNRECL